MWQRNDFGQWPFALIARTEIEKGSFIHTTPHDELDSSRASRAVPRMHPYATDRRKEAKERKVPPPRGHPACGRFGAERPHDDSPVRDRSDALSAGCGRCRYAWGLTMGTVCPALDEALGSPQLHRYRAGVAVEPVKTGRTLARNTLIGAHDPTRWCRSSEGAWHCVFSPGAPGV